MLACKTYSLKLRGKLFSLHFLFLNMSFLKNYSTSASKLKLSTIIINKLCESNVNLWTLCTKYLNPLRCDISYHKRFSRKPDRNLHQDHFLLSCVLDWQTDRLKQALSWWQTNAFLEAVSELFQEPTAG